MSVQSIPEFHTSAVGSVMMLHPDVRVYLSPLQGFLSRVPVQVSYNLRVSSLCFCLHLSEHSWHNHPVTDSSLVGNTKFCVLTTFLRNGVECARVV
jgi:hypothetical protein